MRLLFWRLLWLCTAVLGVLVPGSFVLAQQPLPAPSAPLIDTAGFLSTSEQQQLNQQLLDFHQQQGSQLAVLIVPSIAPETPFDYGTRVMESWKLGRKGVDDGVLLLIVANEHQTQLLVGRGLEGPIPDAMAKRILQDTLKPKLQAGQRLDGIMQAVGQIEGLIKGEALPAPKSTAPAAGSIEDNLPLLGFFALFGGGVLTRLFGRLVGSFIAGCVAIVLTLWLGGGVLLALLAGALAAVFALLLGSHGIVLGGGGGGGWGGGGGGRSGGGWSGGGGDFGGGGASGNW
ncbi:TPM domain-containing protein [Aquitalea palustris]|uniref:TPM domain-containing protein n=1 Tax=Aquitalea palustris TaxID=2480983 RepID=A0A454JJH2_9NEIS|nr:TPM domain-containing protein [Aquitalea palustris]RMC99142.1 TPM domain-containing protein [Aquitalea palustris]